MVKARLMITAEQIEAKVSKAVFGKPLITNVMRSFVVEAIVCEALGPRWIWCAMDYASWDIQGDGGVRVEVKQSAAKQTWSTPKVTRPAFDIRARTGRYEGTGWIDQPGRNADVYVLAWHPVSDETADHRDPEQWVFFVVAEGDLPPAKTIGLGPLRRLADPVRYHELGAAVAGAASRLKESCSLTSG